MKKVKTFTEKPQLDLAKQFLESGEFVWNAGIFVWNVQAIAKAFVHYLPEVAEIFEEGKDAYYTNNETAFIEKAYSLSKSISIDNGVMEKANNVYVVLSDFGWSDLGTWKSLYEVSEKRRRPERHRRTCDALRHQKLHHQNTERPLGGYQRIGRLYRGLSSTMCCSSAVKTRSKK